MSALAAAAPDLPLTLFDDDSTASSLTKLRAGKPLIIDFWTTRCERCPACLDKLDKIAESLGDKVVFAALCLDDPDFAQELVDCLLYTSPSPRDMRRSRMPSSA